MCRLLNSNFIKNFFSAKTLQTFIAYFTISFATVLLISTPADSQTSIAFNNSSKDRKIVTEELVAQANPGDGVIDEIFYVLDSYGVSVNYFYIEGNCHGQYFRKEYGNPQANGNSEFKVASSTLKESSIGNVPQTKQFSTGSVESAIQNVLRKFGFGGVVQAKGRYPNGQPCSFRLTQQQGCDYC